MSIEAGQGISRSSKEPTQNFALLSVRSVHMNNSALRAYRKSLKLGPKKVATVEAQHLAEMLDAVERIRKIDYEIARNNRLRAHANKRIAHGYYLISKEKKKAEKVAKMIAKWAIALGCKSTTHDHKKCMDSRIKSLYKKLEGYKRRYYGLPSLAQEAKNAKNGKVGKFPAQEPDGKFKRKEPAGDSANNAPVVAAPEKAE